MSIKIDEALRIRERMLSKLESALGYGYDIKVSVPRVGDNVSFTVTFQVSGLRLTPMEERYLDMCEHTAMKKGWLNNEIPLDDRITILCGVKAGTQYSILLRHKLGGGYTHIKPSQLITLMERQ